MPDLTSNDLILIVALLGFIAISLYAIFLENKLLTRVSNAEREFRNFQKDLKKFAGELYQVGEAVRRKDETRVAIQTGNDDMDLINLRIESLSTELLRVSRKLGELEHDVNSSKNAGNQVTAPEKIPVSNLESVPMANKKLEQVEPDSFEWTHEEF